jgi:uncharacterized membrane protein (DUF485 family)
VDYYKYKKQRERQWLYLIILSPFFAFSVWISYLCLLVFARAFPDMHFGHGAEVLIVLPFAVLCIVVGIKLSCNLYKTRFVVDE